MAKQNNSNGNKSDKQNAKTEAVENVITPNEVIEVSEKPIKKTDNGKVLVAGTHTSVQVSPATAKIMAKFKK